MKEYTLSLKKDGKYSIIKRTLTKAQFDKWFDELVADNYKIIGIF